jgi:lipopolysaccharide exporter
MAEPATRFRLPTRRWWGRLPGGVFGRSVVTIASGAAMAQLLFALATPPLTRLCTPTDFGSLAVYSSTLTVLLVIASLRYELAIPLPEDEPAAASLLMLTFILLAGTTAIVSIFIWLGGDSFVATLKVPALRAYVWLIPIDFFGAGAYQILSAWAVRRAAFSRIARTKLSQGVGQVASQVSLGLLSAGAPGLLIGDVVGRVARGGGLALLALRDCPLSLVTRATLVSAARRYRRFPLLTTWAGILNIGSLQLPSLMFAASFGAAAAGLYALSYKMLVLPTTLIAQAVYQVFLSRAATIARDVERLRGLTERTALALFACGLPVFVAVAVAGPRLFTIVLGSQWEQAGRYAQVLTPWFIFWIVSNRSVPCSACGSGRARLWRSARSSSRCASDPSCSARSTGRRCSRWSCSPSAASSSPSPPSPAFSGPATSRSFAWRAPRVAFWRSRPACWRPRSSRYTPATSASPLRRRCWP